MKLLSLIEIVFFPKHIIGQTFIRVESIENQGGSRMSSASMRRVSVISFDFRQPKGSTQSRKTRFFRELYGYTQQIKQRLKSGEIVTRTYHYSGILDQIPHIKLGKSVLGVQPGKEQQILKLLRSFDEILFFSFMAWLPASLWPGTKSTMVASNLIERYGYLSMLFTLNELGTGVKETTLIEHGFDFEYIDQAERYLLEKGYVMKTDIGLECTQSGEDVVNVLLQDTN